MKAGSQKATESLSDGALSVEKLAFTLRLVKMMSLKKKMRNMQLSHMNVKMKKKVLEKIALMAMA